jgi:hypothetical protein
MSGEATGSKAIERYQRLAYALKRTEETVRPRSDQPPYFHGVGRRIILGGRLGTVALRYDRSRARPDYPAVVARFSCVIDLTGGGPPRDISSDLDEVSYRTGKDGVVFANKPRKKAPPPGGIQLLARALGHQVITEGDAAADKHTDRRVPSDVELDMLVEFANDPASTVILQQHLRSRLGSGLMLQVTEIGLLEATPSGLYVADSNSCTAADKQSPITG